MMATAFDDDLKPTAVLAGQCSLVRLRRLFLRPDLPSPRSRARVASNSPPLRRDRSHAQPPLGGEHGEDPQFDATRARFQARGHEEAQR